MRSVMNWFFFAVLAPASLMNVSGAQSVVKPESSTDSILRVGMTAPELWVTQWHNGRAVDRLERGRFYIIEFTSILCGPCKKAVPRLERLQNKYSETATIIGVYGDRKEHVRWVDTMVKKMPLTYSVASADPHPYPNSRTWLKGDIKVETNLAFGGFRPYCTTFVVDKQGKVVWIGNALDEPFERIVDAIIEGRDDGSIYANYLTEKKSFIAKYIEVRENVKIHPENVPPTLKALDSLIIKYPDDHSYITHKIGLLSRYDEAAYFSYLRELISTKFREKGSDNLELTLTYANTWLANEYKPYRPYTELRILKTNNYDLLIDLSKHNRAIGEDRYAALYFIMEAEGYYLKGDKENAVKAQKQAIALKRKENAEHIEEDEKILETYMRME